MNNGNGSLLAEGFKHLLGRMLALGLRLNRFDYPPGGWPPPTPARRYIDEFLRRYVSEAHGRCVEFAPSFYRDRFVSHPKVTSYDVWNPAPAKGVTVIGDLQDAPHIADGSFDTIIATHVLACIDRPWLAVAEMRRILSPGGLVLCTNPCVLPYSPHPRDCWRFTRDSMRVLFSDFSRVETHLYGNAVTMCASPFFLMTGHLPRSIMGLHQERFPSIVAVAAWK